MHQVIMKVAFVLANKQRRLVLDCGISLSGRRYCGQLPPEEFTISIALAMGIESSKKVCTTHFLNYKAVLFPHAHFSLPSTTAIAMLSHESSIPMLRAADSHDFAAFFLKPQMAITRRLVRYSLNIFACEAIVNLAFLPNKFQMLCEGLNGFNGEHSIWIGKPTPRHGRGIILRRYGTITVSRVLEGRGQFLSLLRPECVLATLARSVVPSELSSPIDLAILPSSDVPVSVLKDHDANFWRARFALALT
mmetsp:Transcript_6025/g.15363  ORF Transcript_6025/g.15363 Transcript_6025/m.15363 type:complete len:249 (-) Transcript_6025:1850-2596(-)